MSYCQDCGCTIDKYQQYCSDECRTFGVMDYRINEANDKVMARIDELEAKMDKLISMINDNMKENKIDITSINNL